MHIAYWAPLGAFLLTACAPEGDSVVTDDQEVIDPAGNDDGTEDNDQEQAPTCGEALRELGYVPWSYQGDDIPDLINLFVDNSLTDRKWIVVSWEIEADPGFRVSCSEVDDEPEIEADKPFYEACTFAVGTDPFEDEACTIGLDDYAYAAGEDYYDVDGDGIYVPEDEQARRAFIPPGGARKPPEPTLTPPAP